MTGVRPHLFCFGLGYSAGVVARRLQREGWTVSGTCRSREAQARLASEGLTTHVFDRQHPLARARETLASATDVVVSIPPDADGDPVIDGHAQDLNAIPNLRWVGYLSTTGVYGNTDGASVDEDQPLRPTHERGARRVAAEDAWLALFRTAALPVHIFRLAGIYGPGRSAIDQVLAGDARRIAKPGHVFSRIHVDDIAEVLRASMARPDPGAVYNVCDDEAAAPADVVACACRLTGRPVPDALPFEVAAPTLSPMALSFWQDNRRVDNGRIKRELGIELMYPTYREGLTAIAAARAPQTPSPAGDVG